MLCSNYCSTDNQQYTRLIVLNYRLKTVLSLKVEDLFGELCHGALKSLLI